LRLRRRCKVCAVLCKVAGADENLQNPEEKILLHLDNVDNLIDFFD